MKNVFLALGIVMTLLAAGCKKDPKNPDPEQELITTLQLTLTETTAPFSKHIFTFKDVDGDGGADPTIDTIKVPAGKTYHASLLLLDERNLPVDTVSNEINELNTIHQFFYQSTPADVFADFVYKTFDDNGKPLGTEFECKSKNIAASGSLRITLRHELNKNGEGVSSGDITHADGETDIEVDFPVRLY
ncbi:MAG: hypothetical protein RJA25_1734 [Bacteroidota bacterium]|jgi:hypothetical protein